MKNEFLDGKPEGEVKEWQEQGVATFHGRAVMISENELRIGEDVLRADRIVLATGAKPRRTKMLGAEHILISDDFLDLPELPERIVFIGGGYISFEFAHVAIRAGAKEVTILHRPPQRFGGDQHPRAGDEASYQGCGSCGFHVGVSDDHFGFKIHGEVGSWIRTRVVCGLSACSVRHDPHPRHRTPAWSLRKR